MGNYIRNKTIICCLFFFRRRLKSNTWPFTSHIYDTNYDIYMYLQIVVINQSISYKKDQSRKKQILLFIKKEMLK